MTKAVCNLSWASPSACRLSSAALYKTSACSVSLSAVSTTASNDANAAALWGHYAIFGSNSRETSISSVIGTGNGGGIILDGNVVKGKNGFGGELGHVLIPYQSIAGIAGIEPHCNCGRVGDLESLCSLTAIEKNLLPHFLKLYRKHELGKQDRHQAAKAVRGLAGEQRHHRK